MKRKFFVFILSTVMALSLAACDSDSSASATSTPAAQVQNEPITVAQAPVEATPEPTEKPEVTEAPEEKPEVVTEEPTESPEATEAPDNDSDTTQEPDGQKPDAEQNPTQGDQTPVQEQPQDAQSTPTEQPQQSQGSSFDQMIKDNGLDQCYIDGVFSIQDYGNEVGAEVYVLEQDFLYMFDKVWFTQAGVNPNYPGMGFITIGKWDTSNSSRYNVATYSYTFPFGEGVQTTDDFMIPKEVLARLPYVISAMKANPDPNTAPNVPGVTFRPCQFDDAFIQY